MSSLWEGHGIVMITCIHSPQGDIIHLSCWRSNTAYFAKPTGTNAIVALHPHDLGNRRHVPKDEDQEDTEEEKFFSGKIDS